MASEGNETSRLVGVLEVFGNICALNVLFILFSLPVVTMGASFTALYSVSMKMVRKEEGPIFKSFWNAFKENFKQSTIAWLLLLVVLFVIYMEYVYVTYNNGTPTGTFYAIFIVIELVLLAIEVPFLFPIIARFENAFWNNIQNAFLVSISNLWAWAKVFAAWAVPVVVVYMNPDIIFYIWYLFLILIFGLIAYCSSFTIRKTFDVIAEKQAKLMAEKEKEDNKKAKADNDRARSGKEIINDRKNKKSASKKSISERIAAFDNSKETDSKEKDPEEADIEGIKSEEVKSEGIESEEINPEEDS